MIVKIVPIHIVPLNTLYCNVIYLNCHHHLHDLYQHHHDYDRKGSGRIGAPTITTSTLAKCRWLMMMMTLMLLNWVAKYLRDPWSSHIFASLNLEGIAFLFLHKTKPQRLKRSRSDPSRFFSHIFDPRRFFPHISSSIRSYWNFFPHFLATLVALHFTHVSEWVSRSF